MQNFGKIKEIYNSLLSESIVSKNKGSKKVFSEYVRTLKENKALKTQFLVYNNIETKVEGNEFKINEFIKANISLMSGFNKTKLKKLNESLYNKLPIAGHHVGVLTQNNTLYENIEHLIFTEPTPSSVDSIVEATNNIVEYIKGNKGKEPNVNESELPLSLLTSIYVDKYNSEYEDLDEGTIKLIKTIVESDEDGVKELFNDTKKGCLELVNDKLNEGEEKEKLLAVKEKLLDMRFVNESRVEDISDLIELKETLTD